VRAQTIRDLYSHSLNAIVLVVDRGLTYTNKVNKGTYTSSSVSSILILSDQQPFVETTGPSRAEFVRCCSASPEAHFSDFQKQLQLVKDELGRPMQPGTLPPLLFLSSLQLSTADAWLAHFFVRHPPPHTGDVFITRHSNLEAAHIAFHLVGDNDPINSTRKQPS
jgi:hypothetical protein